MILLILLILLTSKPLVVELGRGAAEYADILTLVEAMFKCMFVRICVYIYIYRERERERDSQRTKELEFRWFLTSGRARDLAQCTISPCHLVFASS